MHSSQTAPATIFGRCPIYREILRLAPMAPIFEVLQNISCTLLSESPNYPLFDFEGPYILPFLFFVLPSFLRYFKTNQIRTRNGFVWISLFLPLREILDNNFHYVIKCVCHASGLRTATNTPKISPCLQCLSQINFLKVWELWVCGKMRISK